MSGASRQGNASQQVNFTLDPHWRLVLRIAAEVDGVSVPDLLRPLVVRYLRRRMRDPDLAEAVARIEELRRARKQVPDNITVMPGQVAAKPGDSRRRARGSAKRGRPGEIVPGPRSPGG